LVNTDLFERELKKFLKRFPRETKAVLERLETYKESLNMCDEPQKVIFGWFASRTAWSKGNNTARERPIFESNTLIYICRKRNSQNKGNHNW